MPILLIIKAGKKVAKKVRARRDDVSKKDEERDDQHSS